MSAAIKARISEDMKMAMRNQEKDRLGTIRLILAAIKQREIDDQIILTNEQVIAILDKMIKQRREAIQQYQAGQRDELVAKEQAEIEIIQQYLPAQLSAAELNALIKVAIKETGATSVKEMGKVMAWLKPKVQGRTDMTAVSAQIKESLM